VALNEEDAVVLIELESHEGSDSFDVLLRVARQRVTGEGYRAIAVVRDARVREELPSGARTAAVVPHALDDAGRPTLGEPRVVPTIRSIY